MNRCNELEECIEEYRKVRIEKKSDYLANNLTSMETLFYEKLELLVKEQTSLQESETEREVKYFYLCRLMSSEYTESYESVLGLSTQMLYLDEQKSQVYWFPHLIYKNIQMDMKEVEQIVRKKFLRLEASELFYLKRKLLGDDWNLLQKCFSDLIKGAMEVFMNRSLKLEKELVVLSGNYMDHLQIVWHGDTERR
ncbi:hypothetical protein BXY41_104174 [Lacrimispora xylanisolvens]|uniref:Uncharacterized protein n=1 Tax=Lacrimispora xylanisolvens TaxID=384636 RepID=A0A2S6HUF0_9FIRM|nr:hypothetical protein [Hungatella xylanolytica]PPK81372.1 hypothetical protein BXY41_104174 [Hungatella xylanolytica]